MPTVRQNIAYAYNGFMSRHRLAAVHLIKSALAIVLISLLLETLLFNINYFTSANYNTISLNDKLTLQETVDDQYKVTAVNHVLEFSNLNTEVHNIWLNFDYRQPAQDLRVKIQFTDDAHHTYFDSTEYTIGVPPVGVSTFSDQSEYINLNTTGLVKNLRIEIAGDDVSYPIKLSDIVLNAHHPFDFNTTRFFVCMGLLLMVMLAAVYAFPMLVAVELRTKALITNSFLLALARPHHALAGLIAAAGMFFAAGFLPLALLPLWAIAALAVIGVVADWAAWTDIQAFIVQQ